MTNDQFAEIRNHFIAALECDGLEAQLQYAAEHCAHSPDLRAKLEDMLRAHNQSEGFLASRVDATQGMPAIPEAAGTQIGPYKLLQQIGEGGMGVVWMAEQTQPVQRKVALKVIKPGMDSRQVIARFEAERQALAMMDHVNIARVLDAGATEAGRPYFVMELVHGVPITKYCDDNHLTPRERLELFVPVCQAIQHAHQKGIIHRDIKPSNVMVTLYDGKPVPKVIDFGVAKATEQKLIERTLFTQYGTMIGTLEYMSPEQAEMSALGVDTRTDIYSLGVLLYELLTGSTPLTHKRMKEAAYAEVLRLIKEEEPPKPSTRLSDSGEALASISAQRHMEPAKLTKLVRGELDWIVMKTLDKDRNRRYETANALAAEVQNYLNDETVLACPPSAGYRFRKFARRNKAPLAFTGLVLLILLTVTGGIGWNVRDRAARQTAVEQEVKLALKEAEQWEEQGKWPEAQSAAKRAEGLLAGGGGDELGERVHQLRKDLDMVLRLDDIRLLSSAKFDFESADQAYAEAFGDYGIDVARLPANEAAARIRGRPGVAIALAAALDDWAFNRSKKDKAGSLALTAVAQSADPDPWRRQVREAHKENDRKALAALGASPELLRQPAPSFLLLVSAQPVPRDLQSEIELLRRAQRQYPGDFWINLRLAQALRSLAPPYRDESVSFMRAALAVRPQSIGAHNLLGFYQYRQGKLEEAIDTYRRAIELDPKFTWARLHLGMALQKQGKVDESIAEYRKAVEFDPKNARAHIVLGDALKDREKMDEAIGEYHKAIELDPKDATGYSSLGNAFLAQQKLPEAIDAYRKAIQIHPKYTGAYEALGLALAGQQKLPEAIDAYRKAIELDPEYAIAHNDLGAALIVQKKLDEGIAEYREAIRLNKNDANAHGALGYALYDKGLLDEAIAEDREALRLRRDWPEVHLNLGSALSRKGQLDEAIAEYRESLRLNKDEPKAHFGLGLSLKAEGQLDEAIAEYKEALRLKPDDAEAHQYLGNAQMAKAWDLANHSNPKLRDPQRAVELAKEAVELTPQSASAWQYLGWVQYRAENWKSSIEALETSCKLENPGDCGQWIVMSLAHWKLANEKDLPEQERDRHTSEAHRWYDEAVKQISTWGPAGDSVNQATRAFRAEAAELLGVNQDMKSLKMLAAAHPNVWEHRVTLGKAYAEQGQWDEAAAEYTKAIELKPDTWEGWSGRAFIHFNRKQWNAAVADFSKAIDLAPEVHTNWWHRGHAYLQLAQWDKGAADFGNVVDRWPDGSEGWYLRAVALAQLKQPDKALADLRQAIAKGFNNLEWLKNDLRLAPLRSREDFGKLLEELERQEKSK